MKTATIVSGPEPAELWMWGMISNYPFTVKIGDEKFLLHMQFQKLFSQKGSSFARVTFSGYDELTGCRVKCDRYSTMNQECGHGKIKISKQKASPTQAMHRYGPSGRKYPRKKPLPPFLSALKTI